MDDRLLTPLSRLELAGFGRGIEANVRATTLLHWARRTRVSLIDFVYLDVECAELDALRGAG